MLKLIHIIFVKKNERGIALLFSLTFLALLMVLALAFASNAMLEQKVAYYGKSSASSKLLADSTLSRIATLMQFYDSGVFYSRDTTSSSTLNQVNNPYDYPTDLETKEGDSFVFEWKAAYQDKIHWDFIRQDQMQPDGSTVAKIIGRVAYVIVPDGEVSPLSMVESGLNEQGFNERRIGQKVSEMNVQALDANCGLAGFPGSGTDIFDNSLTSKFNIVGTSTGVQPAAGWTEFPTMFYDLSITDAQTKVDFRKLFLLDAQNDREAYWLDTTRDNVIEQTDPSSNAFELYQRFNLKGTDQDVAAAAYNPASDTKNIWEFIGNDETKMKKLLLLDFNNDVNGLRENGEARERPPQWEDENDYTSISSVNYSSISTAYSAIHSTDPQVGYRVPGLLWLANFGTTSANANDDTLKGTYTSVKDRRHQIAANLVDYCDSDPIPTSNIAAGSWSTTSPAYTGNEKTPYINEVYFKFSFSPTLIKAGGNRTLTIDYDIDFGGEVIDIYNCAYAATNMTIVQLNGEVVCTVDSTDVSYPFTSTPGVASPVSTWVTAVGNNVAGYGCASLTNAFTGTMVIYGPANQSSMPNEVIIKSVKITSAKLILSYSGNNVDYVNLNSTNAQLSANVFSTHTWTGIKVSDTIASAAVDRYFSFQANDPRQNLNELDWYYDYVNGYSSGFTASKNTGVVDDISTAATDRDQESLGGNAAFPAYDYAAATGSNIRTISTAYIRNAPMISPWELGFIHRGKKWQTLNLKEYYNDYAVSAHASTSGDVALNIGGREYSNGDANILDQIKMTDEPTSHKKVNLKTHRDNVLTSLLYRVSYGSKPEELVTGTTINGAPLTTIGTIKGMTDQIKDAAIDYATRANVAEIANFKSVSSDDATQEEICGKIVNLTTASGKTQYFTVIILAQSVRDVGGNGVDVEITKANQLGTISDKKIDCRLGTFDYTRNSVDVDGDGDNTNDTADDIAYDEILSSSKIKVRLYRSLTGEVKILSYQYVN